MQHLIRFRLNKLIRSKLLPLIQQSCSYVDYKIMDMDEYKHRLHNKLLEEAQEVIDAVTQDYIREEIADVLEVVMAIADAYQIQWNDIIDTANQKRLDKGGFEE